MHDHLDFIILYTLDHHDGLNHQTLLQKLRSKYVLPPDGAIAAQLFDSRVNRLIEQGHINERLGADNDAVQFTYTITRDGRNAITQYRRQAVGRDLADLIPDHDRNLNDTHTDPPSSAVDTLAPVKN